MDVITIKIDPKMKAALRILADQRFTSVSGVIKQAIDIHLKEAGLEWREQPSAPAGSAVDE